MTPLNEHEELRAARLEYYFARARYLKAITASEQALKREERQMPVDDVFTWLPKMQAG